MSKPPKEIYIPPGIPREMVNAKTKFLTKHLSQGWGASIGSDDDGKLLIRAYIPPDTDPALQVPTYEGFPVIYFPIVIRALTQQPPQSPVKSP